MTADPFARKVYLQRLPDVSMPTRYSVGSRPRASQLQGFLRRLQGAGRARGEGLELLVLNAGDWRLLFSRPYPQTFIRRSASSVSIVAPADYPPRFLARWDDVLVRAAHAGVRPAGERREFLDLCIGRRWGQAAAHVAGLRGRTKWANELLGSYLFLAALRELAEEGLLARFLAWARVEVAACGDGEPSEHSRSPLKLETLHLQGSCTLQAAALLERYGWRLLPILTARSGSGDVAQTLLQLEPALPSWFAAGTEAASVRQARD